MLYCSITGGFEKKFSFLWHKDLPGQEPWIDYYTPKMCTSMPQTGYILFWFFSLSVTDGFNFLPSHKNTFIWILEFGQLPGLRLWYSSLWMVKRQRRKRHGKSSIFSWSTEALRDDQCGQMFCRTCVPQFLLHMDLHMEWKSFSSFSTSVVFIPSDILANGSQHSHSWRMTLHSCASAAARCGSLLTQPGLEWISCLPP